uniref:Uncharacterized protein n=1 Tax=Cannabis sativa TaxID=3483 RepID=A0A803R6K4_CANSA
MGNCLESCLNREQEKYDDDNKKKNMILEQQEKEDFGFVKESSSRKGSLRLKIVLSKEELEYFMVQLQNKGGKTLQDVLEEIEKSRGKLVHHHHHHQSHNCNWKPSLESIVECSDEVVEMGR